MMIGSTGDRVLRTALPHADAWNTWYTGYGNTPEGFATLNDRITRLAGEVGRPGGEVARSACALVVLDRDAGERRSTRASCPRGLDRSGSRRGCAGAGASAPTSHPRPAPITERSIRSMGEALALLD
jgi:alkanesulfonate monooxygenase SsuD/methylene tetrahydromethanopterin reductase-like flavin-dependent oxidoreductase (luciferase family)